MIEKNIILIGMPGSGKTTLGKRVAKRLNMDFLDTDEILRQQHGTRSLAEIKRKLGVEAYLLAEEEAACSIRCRGTVIAAGGSLILSRRAMRHLANHGTVVFIQVPLFQLQRRVRDLDERGVPVDDDTNFEDVFEKRFPLYRRYAEIVFRPIRLSPGKSAELLAGLLRLLYDRPPRPKRRRGSATGGKRESD